MLRQVYNRQNETFSPARQTGLVRGGALMAPRLPSMQALRALEAFARTGTVWQAADELHLTRSAVSHQLRLLERDLGFALMDRSGPRATLTPQGADYAAEVRRALTALAGAGARQAGRGVGGSLTISVTPGFASSWLCPRIGRFHAAFPDVAVSLVTPRRLDDTTQPGVDLFVAFARGEPLGLGAELLTEVAFTPLCSPTLLNRLGGLAGPGDLAGAVLLHLGDRSDWEEWFALARTPMPASPGITFGDMNMVMDAALAGQGVALGDTFTCGAALRSGALVRPFEAVIPSPRAYWLVVPPAHAGSPAVAAFRGWLAEERAGEGG